MALAVEIGIRSDHGRSGFERTPQRDYGQRSQQGHWTRAGRSQGVASARVRAHFAQSGKALTGIKEAIDDGDMITVSATLNAPPFLSGLTKKAQAALRVEAARVVVPDKVRERDEATAALERVERATNHFTETIAGRLREWRDEDAKIIQEALS